MFGRILIAVDRSDAARRAATFGFELAETYGADAIVLTVREPESNDGAGALVEKVASDAKEGATVETHVAEGRPATAITDYARDHDVDLLVMARRGRSGVGDRLLGSVTERVLRETTVPVLAVPDGEANATAGYDDVLVTTDGSEIAERAAPYAGDLASRYGATLHLLTIVDLQEEAGAFDAGGVQREFVERLESEGQESLERFVRAIDDVDVEVRRTVERATPTEGIEEYVADNDVDLLVMASEGQNNIVGQRLGSVTARVLRTVDVPVLVVPTPS